MTVRADPPPVASSRLVGRVEHVRRGDVARRFRYRTTTFLLDIDELDVLERRLAPWFGVDRRRIVSFRPGTHLVDEAGNELRERVEACLARHGRPPAHGAVLLVANLAVLGYVFNPVSWWCCHDADGELHTVIAEVRNTFGESHTYAMDATGRSAQDVRTRWVHSNHEKQLHVSPFLPMQLHYGLDVRVPSPAFVRDEACAFVVRVLRPDGTLRFLGMQDGRRRSLTRAALVMTVLRRPLAPQLVTLRIHWHALRLWVRRARVFRKPPYVVHEGSSREDPPR